MNLNERPVLSPGCPATREDGDVDLGEARFAWHAHDCDAGPEGVLSVTEMFGAFVVDVDDGYPDVLAETESLTVPIGAAESYLGFKVGDDETATTVESGGRLEMMRKKFCERVLQCRGVANGTCWALGADAVRSVLHEVTEAGQKTFE